MSKTISNERPCYRNMIKIVERGSIDILTLVQKISYIFLDLLSNHMRANIYLEIYSIAIIYLFIDYILYFQVLFLN